MNEKDRVRQVFSKNKDLYITSSTHSNINDLVKMREWLNPKQNMKVLDIATGGGHVAKYLSPYVSEIVATDLTEEMLNNTANHLKDYQNIRFTAADAENLPFSDHTFEIVTCRIAAHHFPNPDLFLAEVGRVLTTNGQFLLIDNVAPEDNGLDHFYNILEKMRDPSHVRARSISQWKSMLDKEDLQIVRETTRKKTLPFREWAERTLQTEEEINNVEDYLMNTKQDIQNYFQIKVKNQHVERFAVDEWMVLVKHRCEQ